MADSERRELPSVLKNRLLAAWFTRNRKQLIRKHGGEAAFRKLRFTLDLDESGAPFVKAVKRVGRSTAELRLELRRRLIHGGSR